jgi:hypothetical protein
MTQFVLDTTKFKSNGRSERRDSSTEYESREIDYFQTFRNLENEEVVIGRTKTPSETELSDEEE